MAAADPALQESMAHVSNASTWPAVYEHESAIQLIEANLGGTVSPIDVVMIGYHRLRIRLIKSQIAETDIIDLTQ